MKIGDLVKYTYADGECELGIVISIEVLSRDGSMKVAQVLWTDGDMSTHNTSLLEAA